MYLLDLNAFLCSLNLCVKPRLVYPTYALLQSGHISLYAPDLLYLSRVWDFSIRSFWKVLFVLSVILMSVFLKRFVMKVVSLPMYVKGVHFCVVLPGFWLGVMVVCLGVGAMCVCVCVCVYVCVWIGNLLFSMMSWMVCRGWCPALKNGFRIHTHTHVSPTPRQTTMTPSQKPVCYFHPCYVAL